MFFKLFILLVVVSIKFNLNAELKIDITQGNTEPIPLALLEFTSKKKETKNLSKKINSVISENLERSGLFVMLEKGSFIEENITFNQRPSFENWRITKAQGLVHGRLLEKNNNEIQIEFRLWDVFSDKQMVAQQLTTKKSNWRRISHVISDIIYQRVTGESGYFDTRIVYISESGSKKNRKKN